MRNRTGITVALFALTAVFAAACSSGDDQPGGERSALRVGERAPSFSLPSAQGEKVSLAEYRGRQAVLLYFSMGPG